MSGPRGGQEIRRPSNLTVFFDKVTFTDSCWIWAAGRDSGGYGLFRWRGKTRKAHRVAYAIAHGYTPSGLVVMHTCDTPACVNPDHLVLGTQRDNVQDSISKGRFLNGNGAKATCKRGHAFDTENTHITPRGRRNCKTCNREKTIALRKGLYQDWKNAYA